jgi:hypothetical protein
MNLPEQFYVFISRMNPVAAHNLKFTKSIASPAVYMLEQPELRERYLQDEIDWLDPLSYGFMSPFASGPQGLSDPLEHSGERCRRKFAPALPSRLSAVFAFADEGSCQIAADRHGWNLSEVRSFRLTQVIRIARCNMEIVSFWRRNRPLLDDIMVSDAVWEGYWHGHEEILVDTPASDGDGQVLVPGIPPLWEYLIDGTLELTESKL